MAQTTLDRRMFGSQVVDEQSHLSDHTITASDIISFSDVGDSNLTKKDTLQGVLDLAGGGSLNYVNSATLSGGSAEFTGLTTYDTYFIRYEGLVGSASANDRVVFHETGAASGTFVTSSSYAWTGIAYAGNGSNSVPYNRATTYIDLSYTYAGSRWMSGQLWLQRKGVSDTGAMLHAMNYQYEDASGYESGRTVSGRLDTGTIIDGIKFYRSSGNYSAGKIYVYGISNS